MASLFTVIIDAQQIRVKNLQITTDQVLPEDGKLRIVQISDVHVGIIIREQPLKANSGTRSGGPTRHSGFHR
ncbi:MAG: hypothetical protein MZV70_49160 [Desulfobacterales bacterium]|nr:hypothetical protein [Desulfobacterales bacterium]